MIRRTIYRFLPVLLTASLLLIGCRGGETADTTPTTPTPVENEILIKFLIYLNEESFGVGDEDIGLGLYFINNVNTQGALKEYFIEKGFKVNHLVDRLYELNTSMIYVTIKSSPTEGYYIVQGGHYDKYFQEGGGGVAKWREDNPYVGIRLTVSRPAYDPKTGFVLLYAGWYFSGLSGGGNMYLMKYEDGKLIKVDYHNMWVS